MNGATILFTNTLHKLHCHNFLRKDGLTATSSAESSKGKAVLLNHTAFILHTIRTIGASIVVFTYKRRTTWLISFTGLSEVLSSENSTVLNKHWNLHSGKHFQHIRKQIPLRPNVKIHLSDLLHHLHSQHGLASTCSNAGSLPSSDAYFSFSRLNTGAASRYNQRTLREVTVTVCRIKESKWNSGVAIISLFASSCDCTFTNRSFASRRFFLEINLVKHKGHDVPENRTSHK